MVTRKEEEGRGEGGRRRGEGRRPGGARAAARGADRDAHLRREPQQEEVHLTNVHRVAVRPEQRRARGGVDKVEQRDARAARRLDARAIDAHGAAGCVPLQVFVRRRHLGVAEADPQLALVRLHRVRRGRRREESKLRDDAVDRTAIIAEQAADRGAHDTAHEYRLPRRRSGRRGACGSEAVVLARSKFDEKNFAEILQARIGAATSSGPLGALLGSLALDVRLMTALQVLQVRPPSAPRAEGGLLKCLRE